MDEDEKGVLLSSSSDNRRFSDDSSEPFVDHVPRHRRSASKIIIIICSTGLVISILINVYMATRLLPAKDRGRSPYSGITYDTPITYHARTDYWGSNETLADERWHAIDIGQATIAIEDSWASEKGLPESNRFPWDHSKGLFTVKGIHDIHCLKMIRHALTSLERDQKVSVPYSHLYHCLDGLRQGVLCHADDTPMRHFENADHTAGEGQQMMCRDWDKLIQWAKAPERDACWVMLDDYKPIKHKLERFAFCSKDSPYYDTMSKYFDIHGHKPPFKTNEEAGID